MKRVMVCWLNWEDTENGNYRTMDVFYDPETIAWDDLLEKIDNQLTERGITEYRILCDKE